MAACLSRFLFAHLTEMDLKGAQSDLDGNPVPKTGGGYCDNAQEGV